MLSFARFGTALLPLFALGKRAVFRLLTFPLTSLAPSSATAVRLAPLHLADSFILGLLRVGDMRLAFCTFVFTCNGGPLLIEQHLLIVKPLYAFGG